MRRGTLKQILLITDGCSNQGEDPAAVSSLIREQGITVNVIGVLEDDQSEQPEGLQEVEEIASAGGGVSRIVFAKALSQTVQMVTRQAHDPDHPGSCQSGIAGNFRVRKIHG